MSLAELKVSNVRSYELFSTGLSSGVTLILGKNGSGKTTLLESIYFSLSGTSFRGRDRDMIAHDSTRADILLIDSDGQSRRSSLQLTSDDAIKKNFIIDGKTTMRMPKKYRKPVVLFEPDELRLLNSSPDRRRKFFDGLLSRLYPEYSSLLSRYQRILIQRNELLKSRESTQQDAWQDHLFTWDIKFAETAKMIVDMRKDFLVTSNQSISSVYSELAQGQHKIHANYLSNISHENYEQKLLNTLNKTSIADSYRGYTSVGPHRDDIAIYLDSHLARETASRGEMRSIMLSYKLLEVDLQSELYSDAPTILMDDVFSELDPEREHSLMSMLSDYQTIITATDLRNSLKVEASLIEL